MAADSDSAFDSTVARLLDTAGGSDDDSEIVLEDDTGVTAADTMVDDAIAAAFSLVDELDVSLFESTVARELEEGTVTGRVV